MDIFAVSRLRHNRRHEFLIKCGSRLPGNTDNAVAVHAVGGDLILEYAVAKAQHLDGVSACLCVFRQNVDTALRGIRIHFFRGTQFLDGTEHAV